MRRYNNLYELECKGAFRIALINLAINSPDDFRRLMHELPELEGYQPHHLPYSFATRSLGTFRRLKRELYEHSYDNPFIYLFFSYARCDGIMPPFSDDWVLEYFTELCTKRYAACHLNEDGQWEYQIPPISPELEEVIKHLQNSRAAEAIIYLLNYALPEVKKSFLNNFLSPDELARRANVKIIVRRRENERKMRGNIGNYLIFTKKDDEEEQLLRFTHQASCVYYLMYLIDRYQRSGFLQPLDLAINKCEFMRLYQRVYDISSKELEIRYQNLLYREENGRIRVGRTRELIYDIRMHVEEHFMGYDEAAAPYLMTAYRHLEIGSEHIVFEDVDLPHFDFQ